MKMTYSAEALNNVLDSLDAVVYVADTENYDLLYVNDYALKHLIGVDSRRKLKGKKCWQVMQAGQTGPCSFCPNDLLKRKQSEPVSAHVWEFQNTLNHRWYQCRDSLILWEGDRQVRLEVATDITERKSMEVQVREAKALAETLAYTDELTGLNNRRAFVRLSEQLLKQERRAATPVSLTTIDLDCFKEVNDQYGHDAGDKLLQVVADAIQPVIREGVVLGRIGGGEFALTEAGAGFEEATQVAKRIQKAISSLRMDYHGASISCTASFGIATALASHASLNQLMLCSNQALYQAKSAGRNEIMVAESGGQTLN